MRNLIFIVFLFTINLVYAGECEKSFEAKDYKTALSTCTLAATHGDSASQARVGMMYFFGNGVKQNYPQAFSWFTKAANQGNATGQAMLGDMYFYGSGLGVAEDEQLGLSWLTKAANGGDPTAQNGLGDIYYSEDDVRDFKQAFKWYTKSAAQGYTDAQLSLGNMYYSGEGITQDYQQAVNWYTKSAAGGNADAKSRLDKMHHLGLGATKSRQSGLKWMIESLFKKDATLKSVLANNKINLVKAGIVLLISICIGALLVMLIHKFTRLKQSLNIGNLRVSKTGKQLAITMGILILLRFSALMIGGWVYHLVVVLIALISLIICGLLYLQLDKIFETKLTRLYIVQLIWGLTTLVGFIVGAAILFDQFNHISTGNTSNNMLIGVLIIISMLGYIFCVITYKIGLNFNVIARSSGNKWFKCSATGMKVAAWTMPILIGLFIYYIAYVIFIIGCIVDKPSNSVAVE